MSIIPTLIVVIKFVLLILVSPDTFARTIEHNKLSVAKK